MKYLVTEITRHTALDHKLVILKAIIKGTLKEGKVV